MPNTIAVCYAPNASPTPTNTSVTGSFYLGNMNTRSWAGVVTQTAGGNTRFFASPITSSGYVIALPNPAKPAPFSGETQPQFFQTTSISDGLYITLSDWVLKHYTNEGYVVTTGSAAAPAGCANVAGCIAALTSVGWVSTYGLSSLNPPV
jgi:hypothetical protein